VGQPAGRLNMPPDGAFGLAKGLCHVFGRHAMGTEHDGYQKLQLVL
jgi:hypothetical protein